MNEQEYRKHPAIAQSTLKLLRRSPAHAKWAMDNPKESTATMQIGTALHGLVLEGFLRAKDIQRLFGIGKSTFYKWIAEGKLSAGFKLGERIKAWKRSEVENLMKAFETQEEAA